MNIKVIFDKDVLMGDLKTGWGVSFLIDNRILFDTGENGAWLTENMRYLKLDMDKIEAAVISHDHWDHTGGLWEILKLKEGLKVYICPGFSKEFKRKAMEARAELIEAEKFIEISRDIFITGQISGVYKDKYMPEQAVVLKTKNGLTIITGCAHPGILKMVENIKAKFPGENIYLILGGLHLVEADNMEIEAVVENFKKIGIIKAAPMHCSGDMAEGIFKRRYKDNFMTVKAGQEMEV